MASSTSASERQTIYIIRHAEAKNNLDPTGSSSTMRDPALTDHGHEQCRSAIRTIPFLDTVDLLCASPLWRTLQTASLVFNGALKRGMKILALPDAQEATNYLSDTGSDVQVLTKEFGEFVDFSETKGEWYVHEGLNGTDLVSLTERAKRLRLWLRKRKEKNIVLVGHGNFIHHMYGAITEDGEQMGGYWKNLEWRSYHFVRDDDDMAQLEETQESKQRREQ